MKRLRCYMYEGVVSLLRKEHSSGGSMMSSVDEGSDMAQAACN